MMINSYDLNLEIKNKRFEITEYNYGWFPVAAQKEGFPQMMPNGNW